MRSGCIYFFYFYMYYKWVDESFLRVFKLRTTCDFEMVCLSRRGFAVINRKCENSQKGGVCGRFLNITCTWW